MFMMITFPWPIPSANVALTELAGNSLRVADQDLEPVGAESGIHRLHNARAS
jgi:hypothetical protein